MTEEQIKTASIALAWDFLHNCDSDFRREIDTFKFIDELSDFYAEELRELERREHLLKIIKRKYKWKNLKNGLKKLLRLMPWK